MPEGELRDSRGLARALTGNAVSCRGFSFLRRERGRKRRQGNERAMDRFVGEGDNLRQATLRALRGSR
jgi:hypothetical protein